MTTTPATLPLIFDTEHLDSYLDSNKIPKFRKKQIMQAVYKESIIDIDEVSTLSKDLRDQLKEDFVMNDLKATAVIEGPETTKFLFELGDGKVIETVLMYHWHVKPEYENELKQRKILRSWTDAKYSFETHTLNRITICISSQV
jgi:adenine C2-methylase RlmN of 23S rRNA A2503 and tRNA A37